MAEQHWDMGCANLEAKFMNSNPGSWRFFNSGINSPPFPWSEKNPCIAETAGWRGGGRTCIKITNLKTCNNFLLLHIIFRCSDIICNFVFIDYYFNTDVLTPNIYHGYLTSPKVFLAHPKYDRLPWRQENYNTSAGFATRHLLQINLIDQSSLIASGGIAEWIL